ncbi:MAG: LCP family protein [Ruminococcus sp.]|nr:LCP family protein [Ruminococcus sp.]
MNNKENMDYVDINSRSASSVSNQTSPQPKNKKSSAKVIKIIAVVLAFIFVLSGSVCLYGYKTLNSFGYEDLPDVTNPTSSQNTTDEPSTEDLQFHNESSGSLLNDPYVLNIMLFGTDRYGDEGLSDTMILLSIDNRHQKIKMTSFLRDTYISIPGVTSHKLNYAYAVGGAGLSIQTIESNYGVQIDRYATVNFSTFKDIVDIMGGVELYVTASEIDYINAQVAHNGQSEYLYASEGMVTLNGQQALWYARNRGGYYNGMSFSGDDWDRTDRQRNFIEAVITNLREDASLTEIVQIVNKVGPMVTTNLKKTEIQSLVANAMTYLTYDIEQCSMPTDGNWSYGYNAAGSVILVNDWYQVRRDLATFIYEELVTTSY